MKRILTTAILGLAVTTAFSQIDWRKGGNAQVPPFAPSSIGTDASWNAPFEIMTNGIQRVIINGVL